MDEHNDTRTKLMTLLNVSHLRTSKRKLDFSAPLTSSGTPEKRVKLNQKRAQAVAQSTAFSDDAPSSTTVNGAIENATAAESGDKAGRYCSRLHA